MGRPTNCARYGIRQACQAHVEKFKHRLDRPSTLGCSLRHNSIGDETSSERALSFRVTVLLSVGSIHRSLSSVTWMSKILQILQRGNRAEHIGEPRSWPGSLRRNVLLWSIRRKRPLGFQLKAYSRGDCMTLIISMIHAAGGSHRSKHGWTCCRNVRG